ncbi:MAG: hypothetical protein ACOC2P_00605 [Spirochaetota bacterium]
MKPIYEIRHIEAVLISQKPYVRASLRSCETGQEVIGYLPSREMAALLPREIIIGKGACAPESIIDIMNELLGKLAARRHAKIWEYQGVIYFGFLKWNSVRITQDAA